MGPSLWPADCGARRSGRCAARVVRHKFAGVRVSATRPSAHNAQGAPDNKGPPIRPQWPADCAPVRPLAAASRHSSGPAAYAMDINK